jgi:hypothetical protein
VIVDGPLAMSNGSSWSWRGHCDTLAVGFMDAMDVVASALA